MKEIVEYKICNPVLDKFSAGGSHTYSLWTKKGKTWKGTGPLRNHLKKCGRKVLDLYRQDGCYVVKIVTIVLDEEKYEMKINDFI